MVFNSYIFVLLLLPVCLAGYYSINHFQKYTLAKCFLIGISLWFYAYFHISYLLLIIGSILFNYLAYILMRNTKCKNVIKIAAITINLAVLFIFKYYDFFINNINSIFKTNISFLNILLPLGISFFTFQQIGFIVDAANNKNNINYKFIDYSLFVCFFPQLVAGPIVSHDELIPQFSNANNKHFNYEHFSKGLTAFILGLSKKVLIADVFAKFADYGFSIAGELNTPSAILVAFAYIIQLYFDFSGYSDMARGLALMLNIHLPLNFDSPFKTTNPADFWTHWHITLSRFLTKYVYIPLGGNRKGAFRTYLNIFIVFFLSGLWHGANWTFVLWGIINGIGVMISRLLLKGSDNLKKYKLFNLPLILINFIFVTYSFIYFRASSVSEARMVINAIKSWNFRFGVFPNILATLQTNELLLFMKCTFTDDLSFSYMIPAAIYFIIAIVIMFFAKNVNEIITRLKPGFAYILVLTILFIMCITSFSGISTFIYYNF